MKVGIKESERRALAARIEVLRREKPLAPVPVILAALAAIADRELFASFFFFARTCLKGTSANEFEIENLFFEKFGQMPRNSCENSYLE